MLTGLLLAEEPLVILGAATDGVHLWITEVCTTGHLRLGDDLIGALVEGLEVEDALEELPAADEITNYLGDASLTDVPDLVGCGPGAEEVEHPDSC